VDWPDFNRIGFDDEVLVFIYKSYMMAKILNTINHFY